MSKILIIEDDKIKIEKLIQFFTDDDFIVRESYHSGLKEIIYSDFDLLILDMTIPIWDRGNTDLGGNYEVFGGINILREMKRKKKMIPTILVTMFDFFGDNSMTFTELNKNLQLSFPDFYIGGVFYNASEDKWKLELEELVNKVKNS